MPEVRVVDTLRQVDPDDWNALFPGEIEDYDYLAAVEAAGLQGFDWRYVLVESGGRLLAAAPGFITEYALDTTLEDGPGKRLAKVLRGTLPRLMTLRLACLGSPCTETAQIGWAPQIVDLAEREILTRMLIAAFEQAARRERCGLTAIKDVPARAERVWAPALAAARYTAMPGLASADLGIDFTDIDAYLATLSASTRKDMRRKLKGGSGVRVEVRRDLDGLEAQVMALYEETRARGDLQFETLTAAYFTGVLQRMGDRAVCVLYFVGDTLLAANLVLMGEGVLLDKFFCMGAEGRDHSLYFLSWFTNLRLCLDHGLGRYRSGQAAYADKLRLGSRLTATTMYFRHRNPWLNLILRGLAPFLAPAGPSVMEIPA
jgi:predicted N-acyltransferase